MPAVRRFHRLALQAYPQTFRTQFGEDLDRVFAARLAAVPPGAWAHRAALATFLIADAVASGLAERIRRPIEPRQPGSPMMRVDSLSADLRLAFRQFARAPVFALLTSLSLALGIGANSAIFSVVNAVLLRPLPYADPDRLVIVWSDNTRQGEPRNPVSPANFEAFRTVPSLSRAEAMFSFLTSAQLRVGEDTATVTVATVAPGMFDLLGRSPIAGTTFLATDAAPRVMLSYHYWQQRFGGDRQVVGRLVTFPGTPPVAIAGVMPEDFTFPYRSMLGPSGFTQSLQPDVWLPLVTQGNAGYLDTGGQFVRNVHYLAVVGRLAPGADRDRVQADLQTVARQRAVAFPDTNQGWGVTVRSLHEQTVGSVRPALMVLLGGVGIVLLITCANVANVLLARAAGRRHDLAVRTALGAPRGRLMQQALVESLALAVAGGAVGLGLTYWGIRALVALAPSHLPRISEVGINVAVVTFAASVSIVTGVVIGILPALTAGRTPAVDALRDGRRTTASPARQRLRSALIVVEVSLATSLAIGAGLLLRSFVAVLGVDPGFQAADLLTMQLNVPPNALAPASARLAFYDDLEQRLKALPGVTQVGGTTRLPLGSTSVTTQLDVEGRPTPPAAMPQVEMRRAVFDYFGAMGIPILRGRAFTRDDGPNAPLVAVVNAALVAAVFPNENPIGRRVRLGGASNQPFVTIIGVIGSIRHGSLEEAPKPELYLHYRQNAPQQPFVVIRTSGDPASLGPSVRQAVRAVGADAPFDVRTMSQIRATSVAERRFLLVLVGLFGATALALAAVGVYGVVSLTVEERAPEVSIRLALGATPGRVLALLVGQASTIAATGVAAGAALALLVSPAVASQFFGVRGTDPITYVTVGVVLLAVATIAACIPARRTLRVDPAQVFR